MTFRDPLVVRFLSILLVAGVAAPFVIVVYVFGEEHALSAGGVLLVIMGAVYAPWRWRR